MNRNVDLAVRANGDLHTTAESLRRSIATIDPTQPVFAVQTLESTLAESIAPRRFNLFLLWTFAAAALLLAVVGIYGVITWSVAEGTREIGVRMALGAQQVQVVRLVVREALAITSLGTLAGLGAALALTRLMQSLLFDVAPNDPSTFAAVAGLLGFTALAAATVPTVRAARVRPTAALRHE